MLLNLIKYLDVMVYVFLGIWLLLLVLCCLRKEFYPILVDSKLTRRFWLATFVFVNPILMLLYLFFGQLKRPGAAAPKGMREAVAIAVVMVVILGFVVNIPLVTHFWMEPFLGYDGKINRGSQTAANDSEIAVSGQAAVIEARNNLSTTSSSSYESHARLAWGRIAVLGHADNELMHRLGYMLAEEMSGLGGVEQAAYYADGILPEGSGRPDVFILLDLESLKESRLPYHRDLEAQIRITTGTLPWEPKSHVVDGRSVPQVAYGVESTLDHQSTTRGYESYKYQMALQDICKQIMGSLETNLDKWHKEYGIMPRLPDYFYGDGEEFELPVEFADFEPEVVFSGPGAWRHQEIFWRGTIGGERKLEIFKQLKASLKEQGWNSGEVENFGEDSHYLRFGQGDRVLEVYQPDDSAVRTASLCIYYQHRFSRKEIEAVLDELLDEEPSMELLTMLQNSFSRRQSKKVVSLLEKNPRRSLAEQVMLADMLRRSGDTEGARAAVRRAAVLLGFEKHDHPDRDRVKKMVEDMEIEGVNWKVPDESLMREMGIREVTAATESFEVEAGLAEAVYLFYKNEGGDIYTVMVRIVRQSTGGEVSYALDEVKHHNGASVSSQRGGLGIDDTTGRIYSDFTTMGTNDLLISYEVMRLDDTPRFKLSFGVDRR